MSAPRGLVGHEALQDEYIGLADRRELSHGYIFFGPRGVGKFSFAYSLANYLETKQFSPTSERPLADVKVLGPGEERSLGIDAVREVKNFLQQHPNASPYRTLIIDQAETLTPEAENALLKVTEEPTPSALIILIATDLEELLPTLRSRMRAVYFAPISTKAMETWLVEQGVVKKEIPAMAAQVFGRPGLAYHMMHNERFQKLLGDAEDFLKGSPASRKSIIKSLTDDELFSLDAFLETLMIAGFPKLKQHTSFWHSLFSLRGEARKFGLNAKLQLTALQKVLESR